MAGRTASARPYGYTALIDPQLGGQITLKPDNCIRGCSMSGSRPVLGTVRMNVIGYQRLLRMEREGCPPASQDGKGRQPRSCVTGSRGTAEEDILP